MLAYLPCPRATKLQAAHVCSWLPSHLFAHLLCPRTEMWHCCRACSCLPTLTPSLPCLLTPTPSLGAAMWQYWLSCWKTGDVPAPPSGGTGIPDRIYAMRQDCCVTMQIWLLHGCSDRAPAVSKNYHAAAHTCLFVCPLYTTPVWCCRQACPSPRYVPLPPCTNMALLLHPSQFCVASIF